MNPLVIEKQEVIGEVRVTSPEMVRISRVKYEGNDYYFVDIRRFWRGYGDRIKHPISYRGIRSFAFTAYVLIRKITR